MSDRRFRIVGLPVLLALWLLHSTLLLQSTSAAGVEAATTRDKFVVASPLIVALACSDGVALLAAHTTDMPLLYDVDDDEVDHSDDGNFFRDLPDTFCGPFRLQTVGAGNGRGAAMLTAGWRADAARLVNSARAIDREYREVLGDSSTPYTLASDLSRYMAIHAGNDGIRPLSCAVLLAFGTNNAGDGSELLPGGDRLWLVDATGTYPVRALCIGGGLTTDPKSASNGDASVVSMVPTADIVNQKLVDWLNAASATSGKERSQSYFDVTAEEGLQKVLELLAGKEKRGNGSDRDDSSRGQQALLRRGTRLELGIVGSSRLVRKRVRDIWGRRSQQPID